MDVLLALPAGDDDPARPHRPDDGRRRAGDATRSCASGAASTPRATRRARRWASRRRWSCSATTTTEVTRHGCAGPTARTTSCPARRCSAVALALAAPAAGARGAAASRVGERRRARRHARPSLTVYTDHTARADANGEARDFDARRTRSGASSRDAAARRAVRARWSARYAPAPCWSPTAPSDDRPLSRPQRDASRPAATRRAGSSGCCAPAGAPPRAPRARSLAWRGVKDEPRKQSAAACRSRPS